MSKTDTNHPNAPVGIPAYDEKSSNKGKFKSWSKRCGWKPKRLIHSFSVQRPDGFDDGGHLSRLVAKGADLLDLEVFPWTSWRLERRIQEHQHEKDSLHRLCFMVHVISCGSRLSPANKGTEGMEWWLLIAMDHSPMLTKLHFVPAQIFPEIGPCRPVFGRWGFD